MKKKTASKVNYMPNKTDFECMKICIRGGYKIYPDFDKNQEWVKYGPFVILKCMVHGVSHTLIDKPFKQSYIGFYTFMFYRRIYNEKFVSKIKKTKREPSERKPSFPSPPPPSTLLPPPPPLR